MAVLKSAMSTKRQVADHEVKTCRVEFKLLGAAGAIVAGGIASFGGLQQLRRRIDSRRADAGLLQQSAEAAFTATNIERALESSLPDAAEHDRVEHMLARPVAPLADRLDPRLC